MTLRTIGGTDIFQMFFPSIIGHIKSPDVPFQYTQKLEFVGDIGHMHDQMIEICLWCRENLEDENLWYINTDAYSYEQFTDTVRFEFNFANDVDATAFKLKWG